MFNCQICKKATPAGMYRRKWSWKTQRGLDNHNCAVDDEKRAEAKRAKEAKENEDWELYVSRRGLVTAIIRPHFMANEWLENAIEEEIGLDGAGYEVDHGVLGVEFHETIEAAEKSAEEKGKGYDEYCRLSQSFR